MAPEVLATCLCYRAVSAAIQSSQRHSLTQITPSYPPITPGAAPPPGRFVQRPKQHRGPHSTPLSISVTVAGIPTLHQSIQAADQANNTDESPCRRLPLTCDTCASHAVREGHKQNVRAALGFKTQSIITLPHCTCTCPGNTDKIAQQPVNTQHAHHSHPPLQDHPAQSPTVRQRPCIGAHASAQQTPRATPNTSSGCRG